jgi:site-specific recombinase XerD
MFSKFQFWNFIPENPFAKIKLKKVQKNEQKFLTEDEFYKLIEFEKNKTLKLLFEFTFLSGLRLSEVANLCWENVDLAKGFITIGSENFTTKSRRIRKVPLCDRAIEILESLKPKIFKIDQRNFIFCKANGFKYSNDFISKSFKQLIKKAGLDPQLHFHSLRHSFASLLVSKGVPIFHVSQLLGHSNISTTQIYSHSNLDDLRKAISLIDKTNSQNQKEVNEQ